MKEVYQYMITIVFLVIYFEHFIFAIIVPTFLVLSFAIISAVSMTTSLSHWSKPAEIEILCRLWLTELTHYFVEPTLPQGLTRSPNNPQNPIYGWVKIHILISSVRSIKSCFICAIPTQKYQETSLEINVFTSPLSRTWMYRVSESVAKILFRLSLFVDFVHFSIRIN